MKSKGVINTTLQSQRNQSVIKAANQHAKAYYHNIDLFKGLLILLVIVGHLLLGTISGHLSKFMIYSFHMPLFIAISGCLINQDRLSGISFTELTSKYVFRIIIPWIIALCVYFVIIDHKHYTLSNLIIMIAFYPFWYVPGLLFYVLFTWLLLKSEIPFTAIVLLVLIASACAFPFNALVDTHYMPLVNYHSKLVLEILKPNYYFFFVWGMYLRSIPLFKKKIIICLSTTSILLFAVEAYNFYNKGVYLLMLTFYCLNICLIVLMIAAANKTFFPKVKGIEWLGKNSLGIYLWHALPLVLLPILLNSGKISLPQYYQYTIISECLIIAAIAAASRIQFINKYLLGVV